MKIGYPCINNEINCTSNHTFRLKNYSKDNLYKTVSQNLACLQNILEWNKAHNIMFFRIGSQLVPFASHPICKEKWQKDFAGEFEKIGKYIKQNKMRISVHPDQFVLLNAKDNKIIQNSIAELNYHADILDLLKLPTSAKIQIHVGGIYGNKKEAIERFIKVYKKLPKKIKRRLVIENDHKLFSVKDLLEIHKKTKVPILFDVFHHECLNNKEKTKDALNLISKTWKKKTDGIPMVDYSNQEKDAILGKHSLHIDENKFKKFLQEIGKIDIDIMLEIKDKEQSAKKALAIINKK
jgi:UV DNA damage endonuclease